MDNTDEVYTITANELSHVLNDSSNENNILLGKKAFSNTMGADGKIFSIMKPLTDINSIEELEKMVKEVLAFATVNPTVRI